MPRKKISENAPAANLCIQAGAFRAEAQAGAMVLRLKAAGFDGRIMRYPNEVLHRVAVGSNVTRQEAESILEELRVKGFSDAFITVSR